MNYAIIKASNDKIHFGYSKEVQCAVIAELPKHFFYQDDYSCEYVKNGMLYIEKMSSYRAVMYGVTYGIYEEPRCYYCGKLLDVRDTTLDHLYPVTMGGISIPNNLRISCKACNNWKDHLTEQQFMELKKIKDPLKQKEFFIKVYAQQEQIRRQRGFVLPSDYYQYIPPNSIQSIAIKGVSQSDVEDRKGKYRQRVYSLFEQTGQFLNPVVVDANYCMLNGRMVYDCVMEHHALWIPTVILENVIFLGEVELV